MFSSTFFLKTFSLFWETTIDFNFDYNENRNKRSYIKEVEIEDRGEKNKKNAKNKKNEEVDGGGKVFFKGTGAKNLKELFDK